MHERGLIQELMNRVEAELGNGEDRVKTLCFEVGALCDTSPTWLQQGAAHYALETWGYTPEVLVEESEDASGPNALGVTLRSMILVRS
jgi:Zn finger protein HypA/HybF involved in hydrogenase expression